MAVSVTIMSRTAEEVLGDFAPSGSKKWRAGLRQYLMSPTAEAPRPDFCAGRPYEQLRHALLIDGGVRIEATSFYNAILGAWYIEAQRRDQEQKIVWERDRSWWRPRSLWNERQRMFGESVVQAAEILRAAMPNEEAERRFDLIPVASYEVAPPEDDQRQVPRHRFVIRMADILRGKSKGGRPRKGDGESVQEPRWSLMGYLTRELGLTDDPASEIVRDVLLHFFPNGSTPTAATICEDWSRHSQK